MKGKYIASIIHSNKFVSMNRKLHSNEVCFRCDGTQYRQNTRALHGWRFVPYTATAFGNLNDNWTRRADLITLLLAMGMGMGMGMGFRGGEP